MWVLFSSATLEQPFWNGVMTLEPLPHQLFPWEPSGLDPQLQTGMTVFCLVLALRHLQCEKANQNLHLEIFSNIFQLELETEAQVDKRRDKRRALGDDRNMIAKTVSSLHS